MTLVEELHLKFNEKLASLKKFYWNEIDEIYNLNLSVAETRRLAEQSIENYKAELLTAQNQVIMDPRFLTQTNEQIFGKEDEEIKGNYSFWDYCSRIWKNIFKTK